MKTPIRLESSTKLIGSLFAAAVVTFAPTAEAAVLQSQNFSFGYGAQTNSATNTWALKTSGATTNGGFTFQPTIGGGFYSGFGPNFDGSTLISTPDGSANYSGKTDNFSISIGASWVGDPTLLGPGVTLDDVQIRLVITSVRIYATYYSATADSATPTIALKETTAGHTDVFTVFNAKKTVGGGAALNALTKAPNYQQYTWNPENFWLDGVNATRSFGFQIAGASNLAIDGFEITGYIEVIPEPSSIALLCGGAGALLVYTRKRRPAL